MKYVAQIMLIFLLGAMSLSLFGMSAGMEMTGAMPDCPFMTHQEVMCAMDVSEHISAWKEAFLAVTPVILLLIIATGAVASLGKLIPTFFPRKLSTIYICYRHYQKRTHPHTYRPLQELFSNGILQPKLF